MGEEVSSSSPQRRFLRRRRAVATIAPQTDDEQEEDNDESGDDADPLPPDREKGRQGEVSIKEALGGLFSSGNIDSSTNNLIFVKRYSHGITFRQRLSYVVFKHTKTSTFIRYLSVVLMSIMMFLYIAEAISIDILLYREDIREDGFPLPCFNLTRNYSDTNIIDLILVPKPIQLWALQTFFAIICLIAASFGVYVRQEVHGSIFKHFHRNFNPHIFIIIILGLLYVVTLLYPSCLHLLFIPSFLYCWPARHLLLLIMNISNQSSLFRSDKGFRTTVISLATFIICFFISCVCVIHHFERLGGQINIFDSYWFTVVTFSTVGYGDIYPGHWTGKFLMIFFIVSALVYLPSKLEKLWSSLKLHRKHHNQYIQRSSVKHVILMSVSLKPLVLRDFINEFYSDPKQIDTQSVILVENEPSQGAKSLLNSPVWSQRITVLLGSGLKISDLARAKAKSAEACFILTRKMLGSTEEADRHTILCSWTLKSYAPKCKQYVHIIRPENKMHLHLSDEVICERELTNSLLAMNAICPGMSTVASLLMHTFPYEGRGYNHSDYQLYEKCSPCEIYQIKLDQSRYFHHFAGKNFLFSSVVAYRKFHVVLLGVRPVSSTDIIFNPGINYIMQTDDTCYYISETQEEYSDYQIVKPTCFQEGLWNASANLGLLSMYIVGIDPDTFVNPPQEEDTDGQKNVILRKMISMQSERKTSLESIEHTTSLRDGLSPPIHEDIDEDIGSLDAQITAEVCNWKEEANLGLQLLRYHGESGEKKKPVVKLNVHPKHCSVPERQHSLPVCHDTVVDFRIPTSHHDLEPISEYPPEIVVDTLTTEVDVKMKERFGNISRRHSQPAIRHFFQRSNSQVDYHTRVDHSNHGSGDDGLKKSSSFFKLNLLKGDTGSLHSGVSNVSSRSDTSQQSHVIDELVVLELDDISEKEELENLEEGLAHELERPLTDEESTTSDTPEMEQTTGIESPELRFIKDQIPVLPYCGCEPLHCYLQPQRPLSEIQISSNCVCDQVRMQWHEAALLVYADRSTPGLFHFIAPLRARYLPQRSLKPIIFILGSQPDKNFISVISELPMIYFMVGSLRSINDLIRAGIMCADCLIVMSPSDMHSNAGTHESLADAENIAALHKIARLFPHVQLSVDVTFRYNIRFLYTTPYEQWSLQHLRLMARKGDHLTYLFLPQVASGKAFSGDMLDTLLYQAYQKPHIINVFRQLVGCRDVEGSGFLWKVSVTDELLKLHTYVRVFQRLASTLGYIPIAVYRTSTVAAEFDIRGFDDDAVNNLRIYLQGRLHSLGLSDKVDKLLQPQHQHFVFLNPSPDFILQEDDIILVIRPPSIHHVSETNNNVPTQNPSLLSHTLNPFTPTSNTPEKPESSTGIISPLYLPTSNSPIYFHEEEPSATLYGTRPTTAPLRSNNSRTFLRFKPSMSHENISFTSPQYNNNNDNSFV